jgi:tetratricopeptide (TPR) repeat protein
LGGAADSVTAGNTKAHELYLAGRQLWQTRNVEDLHNATRKLEQAVEEDPEFALAHSALADAYAFDYVNWRKAEHHANEAMRLDPALGEPHATIGFVRTFWEWRPAEAEPYFKKALLLNPNYATAHQWYALNLAARSRIGPALAEMRTAAELEPASSAINADLCQVLYFFQKYDLAAEQCIATLAVAPGLHAANHHLYDIYLARQTFDEAAHQYFSLVDQGMISPISPPEVESLRTAYSVSGIRAFFEVQVDMLEKQRSRSFQTARYHARLGNRAETYRWLRRAAKERDFELIFIAADPVFESIAGEAEFKGLIIEFLSLNV